jgi:TetR/AcrR family transcriptional regulator, regulator of mycofactocin system
MHICRSTPRCSWWRTPLTCVQMATENSTRSGVELREQRRERTAREIQQAAMSLFAERGYDGVTVDDIAHEAAISERTFFRYFASKDHLLVAEASRRIEIIHESLTGQPEDLDAWQALRTAVLDQSASEEHVGRNAAIWAHLTKEAPALLAKMIMHGALESTHNIEVELARRLGVPATDALPDVIMRVTLAAMQSAYLRWLEDDGSASLVDLTADALDLVGVGFAEAASRVSR